MSSQNTLIEHIKSYRARAHRVSSDSDNSDNERNSPDTATAKKTATPVSPKGIVEHNQPDTSAMSSQTGKHPPVDADVADDSESSLPGSLPEVPDFGPFTTTATLPGSVGIAADSVRTGGGYTKSTNTYNDSAIGPFHNLPTDSDDSNGNKIFNRSPKMHECASLSAGCTTTDANIPIPGKFPRLPNDMPCRVYFLNPKSAKLQAFRTFNELSEYLVDAAASCKGNVQEEESIMNNVLQIPATQMSHYATVGQYLKYLYENDKLMDVTVEVKLRKFSAHRIALCCYSEYFSDLFSSIKGRKIPLEIKLRGISAEAFASFIEFVYTGHLRVHPAIAEDLIIVADFLRVKHLQDRCSVLAENLPLQSALKLVLKCQAGTTGKIYQTVFMRVIQSFPQVMKLKDLLNMDVDILCQMLSSDYLLVNSEYDVFETALRWIVHNIEERVKFTMRIMNLIRFCYMTKEELFTCVETTSLIRGYDKFREVILLANWVLTARQLNREDPFKIPILQPRRCYSHKFNDKSQCNCQPDTWVQAYNLPAEAMADILPKTSPCTLPLPLPMPLMTSTPKRSSPAPKHGKPVMLPADMQSPVMESPRSVDILVIGGYQTGNNELPAKYVQRYDAEDNQWLRYSMLPEPRQQHAVAVWNGKLYLIGGSNPQSQASKKPVPTKTVFQMDLATKKWTRVADMSDARMNHSACMLFDGIYAIGGKGEHDNILASVECYSPATDTWSFVAPMLCPRTTATAASLNGLLYVVGGLTTSTETPSVLEVLGTVETFDPRKNSWTSMKNLRFPRCYGSLVNVNNRLYLCGGATRSFDLKNSVLISVASIDEYVEQHDLWCHRADMIIPRHDAGTAVAGDRIYIIGGVTSSADRVLQSIECYDTQRSAWLSGVQNLPYPARWICCASVIPKWHQQPTPEHTNDLNKPPSAANRVLKSPAFK